MLDLWDAVLMVIWLGFALAVSVFLAGILDLVASGLLSLLRR